MTKSSYHICKDTGESYDDIWFRYHTFGEPQQLALWHRNAKEGDTLYKECLLAAQSATPGASRVFQGQFLTGHEMWFLSYWWIIWIESHPTPASIKYFSPVHSSAEVQLVARPLTFWMPSCRSSAGLDAANVHSIFEEHYVAPTLDDAIATTSNTLALWSGGNCTGKVAKTIGCWNLLRRLEAWIYIYININLFLYINIFIWFFSFICPSMYIYICTRIYMYICIDVHMCI